MVCRQQHAATVARSCEAPHACGRPQSLRPHRWPGCAFARAPVHEGVGNCVLIASGGRSDPLLHLPSLRLSALWAAVHLYQGARDHPWADADGVCSCSIARATRWPLSFAPFDASIPYRCSLATRHYRACSGWFPRTRASCRPLSLQPFRASASCLCLVAAYHCCVGVLVQTRSCVALAALACTIQRVVSMPLLAGDAALQGVLRLAPLCLGVVPAALTSTIRRACFMPLLGGGMPRGGSSRADALVRRVGLPQLSRSTRRPHAAARWRHATVWEALCRLAQAPCWPLLLGRFDASCSCLCAMAACRCVGMLVLIRLCVGLAAIA